MANQMTITFNVENQILSRTDTNRIIEKSKNYLFAEFTFSEDWNNTNKAIIFENNVLRYKIYLDSDNKCQVPNRIIRNDGFTISVIGENSENLVTITTSELYIAVGKGIKSDEEMESIYEITSQSLDVNKNGGTCNLEIPKSYKNCYIVTRNDVSDITFLSNNTYSITLSEEMEQVITGFKQNLYVDWENDFPELSNILGIIKLTNCYPSKKINGDEEVPTYYVFSATDSLNDFSMGFFYEDDTWKVTITYGALADREYVSIEVSRLEGQIGEKSKVVPNPTLVGDEPDLEGAEIDGVKYKVSGGGKTYTHNIRFTRTNSFTSNFMIEIVDNDSTPFTVEKLRSINGYILASGYNNESGYAGVIYGLYIDSSSAQIFVNNTTRNITFSSYAFSLVDYIREL